MRREAKFNETLVGNAQYRGFCMDLLDKLAEICGFNYTIKLVEDGNYGSFVDGKWNGIVNELIDKVRFDLIILLIHNGLKANILITESRFGCSWANNNVSKRASYRLYKAIFKLGNKYFV
jgi:hypothetical protein